MDESAQAEVEADIDNMKVAINQDERFTPGPYNILRVIAAFPLGFKLNSPSLAVQVALEEDKHVLAKLPRTVLITELATSRYGQPLAVVLTGLKRRRSQLNERSDDKDEEVRSKKKKC